MRIKAPIATAAALAVVAAAQPQAYEASACTVNTVYIPVTYTVTAGQSVVSAQAPGNSTMPLVTYTSTTTHTSTVLETLTSSVVALPTTTSPTYAYTTNSAGSTEWISGISPNSGASLVVVTTTIVMQPVPLSSDPRFSAQSTADSTPTITLPAQTSTVYSVQDTDSTSTSISTHYITYTLSEVSQPWTRTITTTRSSFDGSNTSGWNASASIDPSVSKSTLTSIGYDPAGGDTTSTTTMYLTSTIAVQYTMTVYPSTGTPYVTTITALPVTISEGGGQSSTVSQDSSTNAVASPSVSATFSNSSSLVSAASTGATSSAPPGYVTGTVSLSSTRVNSSSFVVSAASIPPGYSSGTAPSPDVSSNYSLTMLSKSSTVSTPLSATAGNVTATLTALSSGISNGPSYLSTVNTMFSGTELSSSIPSPASYTPPITTTASGLPTTTSLATGPLSASRLHITSGNSSVVSPASASRAVSDTTISVTLPAYSGPVASGSASSTFPSSSAPTTFTSKTTRAKGSPLSGTNTFKTTRAKGSPVSASSGMMTSVRSSAKNQTSTNSVISAASISISASPASSGTITVVPASQVSIAVTPRSSLSVIVSSGPSTFTSIPSQTSVTSLASTTSSFSNPFPPSSATATPTAGCGEQGSALFTFDDLPNFLPTNDNNTSISQAPPIFSPYNHLTFSDGYVYAPEPSEPYQPISPPHLAVFLPNGTGKVSSQSGNIIKPGEIGDGPYESVSAFWFDALSAYFGCDNAGPGICTLIFKAYTWDPATKTEKLSYRHSAAITPCTTMKDLDCQLEQVTFPASFRNLTGLQIQAFTNQGQQMFYMDNLDLYWSNSSCAAGLLRQSSQ